MKKTVLSVCAAVAMSSFSVAGGYIAPVPAPTEIDDSGFYAGAGMVYHRVYSVDKAWFDNGIETQDETAGLTGIIGYDFNNYIAVEGRFTKTFWKKDYSDTTVYSLFLKPQYRFRDVKDDDDDDGYFAIYALLGFGNTTVEGSSGDNEYSAWPEDIGRKMMDETSFQWGVGLSYTFKDEAKDKPYRYKDTWTVFVDYTSSAKNASITPTRLYDYGDGRDANYYDKLSVDGLTVGLIYNF